MEGRCAGADEGGYAGGSAKRRTAGRPHRAPLRGRGGADCGSKVLGRCERGKGASASEAVAEYSVVGRAKAGGVCAAWMLRKSGTLKALRVQDYRRDKCLGL